MMKGKKKEMKEKKCLPVQVIRDNGERQLSEAFRHQPCKQSRVCCSKVIACRVKRKIMAKNVYREVVINCFCNLPFSLTCLVLRYFSLNVKPCTSVFSL